MKNTCFDVEDRMIVGIGNDIVEVKRFEHLRERFIERCYTQREINAASGRISFFAANFSVKESVSKSFGTGIRGFEIRDIEVLRDDLGKPYVVLHDSAEKLAQDLGITNIFVSISDTKDLIMTMAVAEG